jgi:hypothetical protein
MNRAAGELQPQSGETEEIENANIPPLVIHTQQETDQTSAAGGAEKICRRAAHFLKASAIDIFRGRSSADHNRPCAGQDFR